jgi:hypothetical protein
LLSFSPLKGLAQDTSNNASYHAFDLLFLRNPWLITSNPAGLNMNTGTLPGRMNFNYNLKEGDYKRVQEGENLNAYSLQSEAYNRIKEVNFYGNFSYDKSFENGLNYSNTNNPYRASPYDMIDTLGNDNYNREFFTLNGAFSKSFSLKTIFGIAYDFNVGVSVQDRDPRPQNKVLDISLRPGFIYDLSKIKLGLNLIYNYYNEEIDIDIIRENTYMTLFKTLGPNVYLYHKAKSFNRLYKRNSGGFDAQINYLSGFFNTLIGSKFLYFEESVQDGGLGGDASWNYLRDLAVLKGMDWKVYGNLQLSNGEYFHILFAEFNIITNLGIEKLENPEQIGSNIQDWVFYLDDQKYNSTNIDAAFSYRFLKMKDEYRKNYSLSLNSGYSFFEESYYIPFQTQNYENAFLSMEGLKTFFIKDVQLILMGGFKYKMNLGGERDFEKDDFINERLLYPDFLYLTSNYYAPKAKIVCEFPMKKLFDKFFINAEAEYYKGDNGQSLTTASFSTGVIF